MVPRPIRRTTILARPAMNSKSSFKPLCLVTTAFSPTFPYDSIKLFQFELQVQPSLLASCCMNHVFRNPFALAGNKGRGSGRDEIQYTKLHQHTSSLLLLQKGRISTMICVRTDAWAASLVKELYQKQGRHHHKNYEYARDNAPLQLP